MFFVGLTHYSQLNTGRPLVWLGHESRMYGKIILISEIEPENGIRGYTQGGLSDLLSFA